MILTNIKVNGYKNLINCNFQLGNFNVLIGANNSGKSNLLEVFSILDLLLFGSDESKDNIFDGYFDGRGSIWTECKIVDDKSLSIQVGFKETINEIVYSYEYFIELVFSEFIKSGEDSLKLDGTGHIVKEYFKYKPISSPGKPMTVFDRENNEIKRLQGQKIQKVNIKESIISIINKIKDIKDDLKPEVQKGIDLISVICKTPVIYNSPIEIRNGAYLFKDTVVKNGRITALPLIDEICKVLDSGVKITYEEVLEEVLDIKKINIFRVDKFKFVTFLNSNNVTCTFDQLSDGTIMVLNIITYLFSRKYPIIAIEELENSLHPKLLKKLVYLLKNDFSDVQIILTTHSPVLINMVQVDDVSVIINDVCGAASIYRVKDRKDLIKKLNNPFSSFGDIFYLDME